MDNDEQISLNFSVPSTGSGSPAELSGTITVDYTSNTTGTISGTLTGASTAMGGPEDTFSNLTLGYNSSTGMYTVSGTGTNYPNASSLSFSYAGMAPSTVDNVALDLDANSYSAASENVASSPAVCFVEGTRIRTPDGEVAIERLKAGDFAVTASGIARRIRWVGHRTVDCRRHSHPRDVLPVIIAAHSFSENRPSRDVLVSAGHGICTSVVDDVVIPASALINGTTIRQINVDIVTYWHVELDSHDILLAENLPAESYLDMGNRSFFEGGVVVDLTATPDPVLRTHADFCKPFHSSGKIVEGVRQQLRLRAEALGWRLETTDDLNDVHLVVDGLRVDGVRRGFSICFALPAEAADVEIASRVARPCDVLDMADVRSLGVRLRAITLADGFETREVALDALQLTDGFHKLEHDSEGTSRWTNGSARLPKALWADCASRILLRVDLAPTVLPSWTLDAGGSSASELAEVRFFNATR